MKYLNLLIISIIILSSCGFSGTPKKQQELEDDGNIAHNNKLLGDSITVDTVIGDFKVFYRVSEIVDTNLVSFSCNEDVSVSEVYKVDKTILLNIQKIDTTSVIAYKTIGLSDFESVIPKVKEKGYVIDSFYLKEVAQNAVIFGANLCVFAKETCEEIDIYIDKNGTMKYMLLQ